MDSQDYCWQKMHELIFTPWICCASFWSPSQGKCHTSALVLVEATREKSGPAQHAVAEMGSPPLGLPAVVERRKEHRVTGAGARTERRSLETMVPTPQEAARAIGARRHRVPGMQGRRHKHGDVPSRASERCAMTSRTNRHSPERNQRGETRTVPSALQRRRQEALERSLAGDPIAVICREMGCAKSWLSQWKHRSQVTEPAWFQEHARRPETTPTTTPEALEADIVRLRHTWSPDGSGTVSAGVMRDHLRHHRVESMPSRRTISRMLNRQAQEVNSHSFTS